MKPPSVMNTIFYGLIAFAAVVVLVGIFRAQPSVTEPAHGHPMEQPVAASNLLVSTAPSFNFGTISMAAGKVSHRYWIRNAGQSPVTVTKLYTSCMCTEATLITQSAKKGPFGMLGHGSNPGVFERIAPGGIAQVEAVFDPAAHGPAGIGPTERVVTVSTAETAPLELQFTALVRP